MNPAGYPLAVKSSNPVLSRIASQRPVYTVPGGPAGMRYQTHPGVQPSPVQARHFTDTMSVDDVGIAAGLPRRYGWLSAFGLLVELVWMYLEIPRLISYFMDE